MKSISFAKHQVKLQLNIQKPKTSEFIPTFSPLGSCGFLQSQTDLNSCNGFLKEEEFLYETSMASGEFSENYQIIERLGKGVQGEVFKIKEIKSGEFFAAKFYFSKDPEIIQQINLEKQIISALSHPKIIKYKTFCENVETNCRILITEFFDAIQFNEFLSQKDLSHEEIHAILLQIISGLSYLHDQNILHQDFNVKNILINARTHNIKIIDFGISQKIKQENVRQSFMEHQGNFKYRAPEGWLSESQNCYFSDIWGLCLITWSLFLKKSLSSKDALKLNLIDEKLIRSLVLKHFLTTSIKNLRICEFLCRIQRNMEKSKIL